MENRSMYTYNGERHIEAVRDGSGHYFVSCMMPIITEGDVIGCVASLFPEEKSGRHKPSEVEQKLIQTAANFLGRQME